MEGIDAMLAWKGNILSLMAKVRVTIVQEGQNCLQWLHILPSSPPPCTKVSVAKFPWAMAVSGERPRKEHCSVAEAAHLR